MSWLNQTSTEGQGNTGNDHLPEKHVIVRGILLTSLIYIKQYGEYAFGYWGVKG